MAGLSSLGSANMDMTLIMIVSTVWMGNHLSSGLSYPHLSSPGSCRIDIQTSPFLSTVRSLMSYVCVCVCVCECLCIMSVCVRACVCFRTSVLVLKFEHVCVRECVRVCVCVCVRLEETLLSLDNTIIAIRLPFGCHISLTNFIFGGFCGYSFGKSRCALKNPPSLHEIRGKP